MASNFTLTLYLGSGEEGLRNDRLLAEESEKANMKKSEFVFYCVMEELKRRRVSATIHSPSIPQ